MAHRVVFLESMFVENGEVVREVIADSKWGHESVYREYESGKCECRYLYFTQMSGYTVVYPNEKVYYRYCAGHFIQQKEDFAECKKLGINGRWITWENDTERISEQRPDLKYLIKKYWGTNCNELMELIKVYKYDKTIEPLVEKGLKRIALDKRLQKLTKEKKLEVINYIKNDKGKYYELNLTNILFCIKHNVDYADIGYYQEAKYKYDVGNYLKKYPKVSYREYQDYIRMCKELGKNLKDNYWLYPTNFQEKHNQVIKELENKIRIEKENERIKMETGLRNIADKLKIKEKIIDGYSVDLPRSIEEVKEQAKVLNQCLITCNYSKKVIDGKSILVFIKKDKKPIATAELDYDKKILQFYGDEYDRDNCTPSEAIKNILDSWISQTKIDKRAIL